MPKRTTKKATPAEVKKELKRVSVKEPGKAKAPRKNNKINSIPRQPAIKKEANKPSLRSVYSNSKYNFLPLGFATDFKTNQHLVIFSDLATGHVHTIALSGWNRWKLKEVQKINTET